MMPTKDTSSCYLDSMISDCCSEQKVLIQGVTESGESFRPSDWAERVSGGLCTFENQRMQYSPMLQPTIHDGAKCVQLDPALKQSNPDLYESIAAFVENNHLKTQILDKA